MQSKKELWKAINPEHKNPSLKLFDSIYVNSKFKTCPNITDLLSSDGTAGSSGAEMATMLKGYFSCFYLQR